MRVPVDAIEPGMNLLLPNGTQRAVVRVERSDHIGLEPVDGYVVVYDTGELTRARDGFRPERVLQGLRVARAGECFEVVAGG